MPIIAKSSGTSYPPAPQGTHAAVCVDVVDLGMLKVAFGGKEKTQHKIRVVWQIEELRDDGKPHQVSRRYTNSLHEKAALRKDLESWRGKPFTPSELEGFDLEVLLSVGCFINVMHQTREGQTYANVAAVMRLPKGMIAPSPRDYVRVCEREPAESAPVPPEGDDYGISDSDVPF
jgi:hypothetical protein